MTESVARLIGVTHYDQITLDDGSRWRVGFLFQSTIAGWQRDARIAVTRGDNPIWRFRLINLETGEHGNAALITTAL